MISTADRKDHIHASLALLFYNFIFSNRYFCRIFGYFSRSTSLINISYGLAHILNGGYIPVSYTHLISTFRRSFQLKQHILDFCFLRCIFQMNRQCKITSCMHLCRIGIKPCYDYSWHRTIGTTSSTAASAATVDLSLIHILFWTFLSLFWTSKTR